MPTGLYKKPKDEKERILEEMIKQGEKFLEECVKMWDNKDDIFKKMIENGEKFIEKYKDKEKVIKELMKPSEDYLGGRPDKEELIEKMKSGWENYLEIKERRSHYLEMKERQDEINKSLKGHRDYEKFRKGRGKLEKELNKTYKATDAVYTLSAIASMIPAPIYTDKPEWYIAYVGGIVMFFATCLIYSKSHEGKDKIRGYV